MDANERDAEFLANKQDFAYFLSPDNGDSLYGDKVEEMVNDDSKPNRLIINLRDINEYDPTLRRNLLASPMQYIPAWEEALKDFINHSNFGSLKKVIENLEFQIGLRGSFGAQRLTPQKLMSQSIGSMVCVEGIVTKVSLVRPKVLETVHFCEATQQFHTQKYRDATSLVGVATGNAFPTTDGNGNSLTTEFGLCTFKDHQKVYIQDMPERTEAGTMPRTIECILDNDLVDCCKPGDRIQMIGIYRALSGKRAMGASSGRFHTVILANNVVKIGLGSKSADSVSTLSANEIKNIKKMAKRKDIFNLMAHSLVPAIYGHTFIKKAIVLQLLGGIAKDLDNGTHLRGDINILMVGDPSCGKSQLLRGVMNVARLCINTTGRGSSGVGLTAAVTTDKDSGVKRLEAGAMVLADGGVVCIDEFDKMTDMDRTAIHEVMEQQTVTIAKAGIHTSLNARCSVIAAANPVYGMYDRFRKPHENIGLPDSLLSRFDLLFIVLDRIDTKIDKAISEHVLKMHLTPHCQRDDSEYMGDTEHMDMDDDEDVQVWEKRRVSKKQKIFTIDFVKKFIQFAKTQYKPVLTDEACEAIANQYGGLREEARNQTLPITARCLETVIRLSTAHAKLRLSKKVTIKDVEESMKVLQFALTNDADPEKRTKEKRGDGIVNEDDDDNMNGDNDGGNDASSSQRRKKKKKNKSKKGDKEEMDGDDDGNNEDEDAKMGDLGDSEDAKSRKRRMPDGDGNNEAHVSKKVRTEAPSNLDTENVTFVTKYIANYFRQKRISSVDISDILGVIGKDKKANVDLSPEKLKEIISHLHDKNKIFFMDPVIHQI